MNIGKIITDFFIEVGAGNISIYNEFSLQHELGIYLRKQYGMDFYIQFERNTGFFEINEKLIKKEIDIVIFDDSFNKKIVLELKYPNNGRHPEALFDAVKDIKFMEQLVSRGFDEGYAIIFVEDPLFYSGSKTEGIYSYFRTNRKLNGTIFKPTGQTNYSFELRGEYDLVWNDVGKTGKYITTKVI